MTISRFATLGLACLFASACTVVVQPAANQPRPAPSTTEQDADVETTSPEPTRRPHAQVPTTGPTNPEPDPGQVEPRTPSRRPSPRPDRSNRLNLGVPPGHLPGPGECRVWVQGLPPGQQARSRTCSGILATTPVGSWILYRPAQYERQIRVRYLHATRQMVIAVRAFDAETGAYLRDYTLAEDDDNMAPTAVAARPPIARPAGDRPGDRGNSENAPGRVGENRGTGNSGNSGNNGVAAGRRETSSADSANVTGRGNQGSQDRPGNAGGDQGTQGRPENSGGNASNQGGNARETGSGGGDNGVAAGRRDTSSADSANVTGRGNQGSQDRQGNAGGNQATQGRPENTGANASNQGANARETGDDRVISSVPKDRRDNARVDAAVVVDSGHRDAEEQAFLGIHPRFLPDAGMCRVWVPNLPYGRQARAGSCAGIADEAPAGAWILRRTLAEPGVVNVEYVDEENSGVIVRTTAFDVESGMELRDKTPRRE